VCRRQRLSRERHLRARRAPSCVPGPIATRPNVILLIADDQGECHWGTVGECRSTQTGTPIPPPSTPNLDLLSGYGTVFPIAHNTASWCFPSLDSMLTGRYARSYGGGSHIADRLTTIPKALRSLGGTGNAPADPYHAGNVVGGYWHPGRRHVEAERALLQHDRTPQLLHRRLVAGDGGAEWYPVRGGMSRGLHLQPVAWRRRDAPPPQSLASVRFQVMSPFVSGITTDLSNVLPFQRYCRSSCWSSLAT
jgi:hypothetical protein